MDGDTRHALPGQRRCRRRVLSASLATALGWTLRYLALLAVVLAQVYLGALWLTEPLDAEPPAVARGVDRSAP